MTNQDLAAALPFPVTPRRPGDPEPDLTGFQLTHRAMRSGTRDVAAAAARVAAGGACAPDRHRTIAYFAEHVLAEISAHHHKEDAVLWPVICASTAGRVDLTALSGDHAALEAVLVRADAALARFRTDVTAADELAEVLTEIADELDEHIADEEATIFPVMREHVSAADFARCEKMFQRGVRPGHLAFIMPWFIAQCTEQERRDLLPTAPLPLRLFLRATEPRWHRRQALIRS